MRPTDQLAGFLVVLIIIVVISNDRHRASRRRFRSAKKRSLTLKTRGQDDLDDDLDLVERDQQRDDADQTWCSECDKLVQERYADRQQFVELVETSQIFDRPVCD